MLPICHWNWTLKFYVVHWIIIHPMYHFILTLEALFWWKVIDPNSFISILGEVQRLPWHVITYTVPFLYNLNAAHWSLELLNYHQVKLIWVPKFMGIIRIVLRRVITSLLLWFLLPTEFGHLREL